MPLNTFVETLLWQVLEEKKGSSNFLLLSFCVLKYLYGADFTLVQIPISNTLKEQLGRILRYGNFVLATMLISLEPKNSIIPDALENKKAKTKNKQKNPIPSQLKLRHKTNNLSSKVKT